MQKSRGEKSQVEGMASTKAQDRKILGLCAG